VIRSATDSFAVTLEGGGRLQARAVVYAAGARVRRLDVPGEREFLGRGVSYSALSYAHLLAERTAVVVGNGRRALRAVAELVGWGTYVHWVVSEPKTAVAPPPHLPRSRYTRWPNYRVLAINGDAFVQEAVLVGPDGVEEATPTNGVFIERGLIPNSEPIQSLVELDEAGRIKIDHRNHTSCPGFFAAGDVTNVGAEQVLIAVGEGARAALSAVAYLLPGLS
jgi:thioredoxin reductase